MTGHLGQLLTNNSPQLDASDMFFLFFFFGTDGSEVTINWIGCVDGKETSGTYWKQWVRG